VNKQKEIKKIESLKKYFEKEPAVILAFLFGSYAKGLEMEESDFDVAVYLKEPSIKKEDEVWSKVSQVINENVDLVCLNNAPAMLVSDVFKTGIPLKIGDKKLYWELYLKTSSEAEDFLEFIEDFWRIKQRAKSLSREEKERLRVRFDFLNDEVKKIDKFKELSWQDYLNNWDKRKIVERWVETIINAAIDIAKIVLASEQKEMPRDYKEALFKFALLVGFDAKSSEEFSRLANLRNILAHEYLDILYERIQNFIKEFPGLYKKTFIFLEKYLK